MHCIPLRNLSLALGRIGIAWLGLVMGHCALKIDDPVGNLEDKISSPVVLTDSLLFGDWVGDSTYNLRDTDPGRYAAGELTLTCFRDGRFRIKDTLHTVFPSLTRGRFHLSGDSVIFTPEISGASVLAIAKLTFLGNYLSLYIPSQLRYSFYHKIRMADTLPTASYLDSGFWMLVGKRDSVDQISFEKLTSTFQYLYFRDGKMRREYWHRGIPLADSGDYQMVSDTLVRENLNHRGWVFEPIRKDTLRLWPLRNGIADSGFEIFVRRKAYPLWHRDLSNQMGYWRGDSVLDTSGRYRTTYEAYFDLSLQANGSAAVFARSLKVPAFKTWELDSGRMRLKGNFAGEYALQTKVNVSNSDTLLEMENEPTSPLGHYLIFYGTKKDSTSWGANPIARFPLQSHALIRFQNDSLAYLSYAKWANSPERAEFAQYLQGDTLWMVMSLPTQSTFSSSQVGFQFKLAGKTIELGAFQCTSRPDLPLTLRLQAESNTTVSVGTLQGACHIDKAERAPTDSTLPVQGEYRILRKAAGSLESPLW